MTELECDYRLVYESMGPGHDKDRQYLSDKYGVPINNLADLNALGSMLFERLTPAQKERDLKDTEEQLSSAASILGRKGGRAKSEAKAKAARENAKKGGYPKGRPRNTGLTALQRQAWDLRQQGLGIKDIAAQMGRQPENVRQILARAANNLNIPGGWAGKITEGGIKMNTYTISKEWGAEYSPSMSGHCTACGKPLNGRDTHIRHTVRAIDLNLDIKHNIEAGEIQICDRHKNLSSAVRKAFKAITGFDCGPLRNSL